MRRSIVHASVALVVLLVALAAPIRAQEATPASGLPRIETLLDATTDALPSGHSIVAVDRWRLQPSATDLTLPPLGGLVLVTVESGELSATSAAGEQVIAPGDTFTVPDAEVTFHVAGPDDATMFVVYVIDGFTDTGFWASDPIAHTVDFLISTSADALPGGSASLLLERFTLPPGSAMPPQEVAPLTWVEVGEGALGLTLEGERLPLRWDSGEERTFRQGQYLPALRPGTRMIFRNAGDAPLVLYRLTLTPEAGAMGTPAA